MRVRPAAVAVLATALAGCGHESAPRAAKPPAAGTLAVQRATLRPGLIGLIVRNDTRTPARLTQVAIDRGFVAFAGAPPVLAPHTTARLRVPYAWVAGEGYDVKVLTSTGATLTYRVPTA